MPRACSTSRSTARASPIQPELHRLCRAVSRADTFARRHRHHGQSEQSQTARYPQSDPRRRRQAPVFAAVQPRPQSDRAGLRQAQTPDAQSRRTDPRSNMAPHRIAARCFQSRRMPQLSHQFRIRINLMSSDSSSRANRERPRIFVVAIRSPRYGDSARAAVMTRSAGSAGMLAPGDWGRRGDRFLQINEGIVSTLLALQVDTGRRRFV